MSAADSDEVRLDVWLWAARFFKTRTLAKEAVELGRIQVDGQTAHKPARRVREKTRLIIDRAGERFEVLVVGVSEQRGPATVAQALYVESESSVQAREVARAQRRAEQAGFRPPPVRPDKQARRKIQSLQKPNKLPPWFPGQ